MKRTYFSTFLFVILMLNINAQVETIYVRPNETDPAYTNGEDSSAVSWNENLSEDRLFLFFGGTNSSSSEDYSALRLYSADLGFRFINLSYPNDVAAASLSNDSDSEAFDYYREEICFGRPMSNAVNVDSLNSIKTRTINLLKYLEQNYPNDNWDNYLTASDTPEWSKIIVGGHSQGAGHAAYFAKTFNVDRALMFAGPNDYSDYFSAPANWISTAGQTTTENYYSYLSINDEIVDYSKQYEVNQALGLLGSDDSTLVDNESMPYGGSHVLYTRQNPGIAVLHHNVPIKYSNINTEVWEYMLTSTTVGLSNFQTNSSSPVYPNPAQDYISFPADLNKKKFTYIIYNHQGQVIKKGIKAINQKHLDITNLSSGVYYLQMEGVSKKIIKR